MAKEIEELKEKEAAYCQTINEADSILSKVQEDYQKRIQGLEQENSHYKEQLGQLQAREAKLKSDIRILSNQNEAEASTRLASLMEELLECESRERLLKDRVFNLENVERELKLEMMQSTASTDGSVRSDFERLESLQQENNQLHDQVSRFVKATSLFVC